MYGPIHITCAGRPAYMGFNMMQLTRQSAATPLQPVARLLSTRSTLVLARMEVPSSRLARPCRGLSIELPVRMRSV
jgi:hypothetical protein